MNTPTTALRQVQVALHEHLLGSGNDIAGELRGELHDQPTGNRRFTVEQRLQIYHDAYRSRLLESLQDNFEKSWTYLGDAAFASAAAGFIEGHPSRHRNLRWYGDQFTGWLGAQYPADLEVSELALLDWRLRGAFDGIDAIPVAAVALSRLSTANWTTAGCRFVHTLDIAPLRFNSVAIWHALERGETPPEAAPLAEPTWVLIWRKGWQPHFRTLGADEHGALTDLQAGASFATVCKSLSARFPDQQAATIVATWLRAWLDDELIEELTGLCLE